MKTLSVADGWTVLVFAKSVLRREKNARNFLLVKQNAWRDMKAGEVISLAPVPICSSVPAMFLLQKIALKCFDEWRNFLSSISFGVFFLLFFSSTLTRNKSAFTFNYITIWKLAAIHKSLAFFFLEENKAGYIPVQAPALTSLLWNISAVLQEDWLCSSAKWIHHVRVCYSSVARMPYPFQNPAAPA